MRNELRPPTAARWAPPSPFGRGKEVRSTERVRMIGAVIATLLLAACASQIDAGVAREAGSPGFWWGLWHGFIFPWSWIGSLFNPDVAVNQESDLVLGTELRGPRGCTHLNDSLRALADVPRLLEAL